MITLVIFIMLVCAIISSLIGRPKGFPVCGFFIGLVLGLIGIAIVALWPPSKFPHRGYQPKDPYQPKDCN